MEVSQTRKPGIRFEDELLLCCARLRPDPQKSRRLTALVRGGLDWSYLLEAASRHGLTPLVYRHLNATCPEDIPPEVRHSLRDQVHQNAVRNMFLTSELLDLLSMFAAQGISAIPLRGPTLAAFAYHDLSLRQFSDLDLLIRREDFKSAKNLLVTRGYRPCPELDGPREMALVKSHYDYEFFHPDKDILVELHWEINPSYLSFQADPEFFWQRLERKSLGGQVVSNLSPEDLLLAICLHSTKHGWQSLGWICDVATLIGANPEMDWPQVQALARRLGIERMLFLGLYLAQELLSAALPKEVCQRLKKDAVVKSLAGWVLQRLFREPGSRHEVLETVPFHLKVRERLLDKVRYCIYLAFSPSPEDWTMLPLPRPLFFLYSLLRPFRLLLGVGREK